MLQQSTADDDDDMYRGPSPIFDVPEFPTLRRVKPLPKRRRTSDAPQDPMSPVFRPSPLSLLGPDASPDDLLAHADSLSTQMALQAYYMPILGGMHELFRSELDARGADLASAAQDEEPADGGDYVDHLQQPGNTKKRKVPANAGAAPHDAEGEVGDDEPGERGALRSGRVDQEPVEVPPPGSPQGPQGPRRGKVSAATLAGLQHKEMLKSRKRQLAAVLGALSHGDTLALDQALSANYAFAGVGVGADAKPPDTVRVRLSRRRVARFVRATKALRKASALQLSNDVAFPSRKFTFVYHSSTSDRLSATKEEVAMLRSRFEAELARQAANAMKAAALSELAAAAPSKTRSKRAERAQQRARTATKSKGGEQNAEFLDQSQSSSKTRGGKKKKRSALANASNPHHLRNYVPSRLPNSMVPNQAAINAQNYLGPPPLRFLSAEIAARRRKKGQPTPTSQLTNPIDEWICPFCEYKLFYGDEEEYRRMVRSRKKILRRRRRAQERAAAAASGNITTRTGDKGGTNEDEDEGEIEGGGGGVETKRHGGEDLEQSFG